MLPFENPTMPSELQKSKMSAKVIHLVFTMVALSLNIAITKTDRSFDEFLKSDHTNNWAVLVRVKLKH